MPVPDLSAPIIVPPQGLPAAPEEAALHARLRADPRVRDVLIPHSHLRARLPALAAAIARDGAWGSHLTLAILLKGAAAFGTDLGPALFRAGAPPVRYEFIRASTYGRGLKTTGERARTVHIALPPGDLTGADVLLVDDLVDQAFTLTHMARALRADFGAARVRICVLAEKVLEHPSPEVAALRGALRLDYVGFRVPDRWIAGYGIDAGEDFRNLPCIVTVNEEHYHP